MPEDAKAEKWFYRADKTDQEEGPFDLVEMAGFLRACDIVPGTLTKTIDDPAWKPFQERREFSWARDMPVGVIMKHLEMKATKAEPSSISKWFISLFVFAGGLTLFTIALFLKAYFIGSLSFLYGKWDSTYFLMWQLVNMIRHAQH